MKFALVVIFMLASFFSMGFGMDVANGRDSLTGIGGWFCFFLMFMLFLFLL